MPLDDEKSSATGQGPPQRFHGAEPLRGLENVVRSTLYEGRFGRLFRSLPPQTAADADLIALADRMFEPEGAEEEDQLDSEIPAGFTYFGQFLDHDITFDPNSKLQRENDPDALRNFRTPRLDLDSVYASGPADTPFIYDQPDGLLFLIDPVHGNEEDLPRNRQGRALLGDPRNDENLIVSQLHLIFLKFHNQVVKELRGRGLDPDTLFETARRTVTWHYQWAVIHNFLTHVVGGDVVKDILKTPAQVDLKFFNWRNQPFMPVEFSVAAYRFGHSMIRFEYELNDEAEDIPIFGPSPDPTPGQPKGDLRGFRRRPKDRQIEWERFFIFPGKEPPQMARRIDTQLARDLKQLPAVVAGGVFRSLAQRNLLRGKALSLPAGQAVARAMGIPENQILTDAELGLGPLLPKLRNNTPLWYYILRESAVRNEGKRLGPVGGRIVAEVIIGLIAGDPQSYLNIQPNWQPKKGQFGAPQDGRYNLPNLIQYAQRP
jgi:Animal haem peroxidase